MSAKPKKSGAGNQATESIPSTTVTFRLDETVADILSKKAAARGISPHQLAKGYVIEMLKGPDICLSLLERLNDQVEALRKASLVGTEALLCNAGKISWERSYQQNDIFSPAESAAFAKEIRLRILQVNITVPGFRNQKIILVTTLLDPKRYPADELAKLYLRRWSVEVFCRDIKQTMGMDILRCQTPAMIQKEIHLHAIA